MGRVGKGLLAPTLALLNLRLGYWMKNPRNKETSWLSSLRPYLLAEILGIMRSDSNWIYVTDGGHIDNIGLYQLLKRKCRVIIVVDAEADPGMNFGAFVDVQRFARIDFGTRIEMDWKPVRDAALARAKDRLEPRAVQDKRHLCHFAVGRSSMKMTR